MSLKYILFLVNSLSENSDAIEQGKSQIIYDILNCLQEKMDEYWPNIKAKLSDQSVELNVKQDITNLLLKSFSKENLPHTYKVQSEHLSANTSSNKSNPL